MNREILFRGRRMDNGEWVYGNLVISYEGVFIVYKAYKDDYKYAFENVFIQVDPSTVGQFTGLHDKNGKDIYEGDILLHTGTNQCDLEVHFKEGAFWGKGMFTDCVMDMFLKSYDFQSVEVIGNIHENPELLSTEPKDIKE